MEILYSPDRKPDEVFEQYKDYYILSAMDKAYNGLPQVKKKIIEMSETELNKWLTIADQRGNIKLVYLHWIQF